MLKKPDCLREAVKYFTPSWFATVMGTGILAMTSLSYSQYIPYLRRVSLALSFSNIALFFLLLVPWVSRWIFFRKEALLDLEDPVVSNFYPTIAIGMVVLAANFLAIGQSKVISEAFWLGGAIFTAFFSILIPYIMFRGEHVKVDHVNPAWFIPPVALIVIPMVGSSFITEFSGMLREFVIVLDYFGWGSGFFIYLALLGVCFYRFILHHPLPNTLAPTVWINLGPIGAGSVALIGLTENSTFLTTKEPFFAFSLILWGFGIWWFLMAVVMTFHYITKLELPYEMSWWSFTFPLGAFVAASHSVATIFRIVLIDYIGFGLYWLLALLWAITAIETLRHIIRGHLSKPREG